jgi:hypothetical protein
MLRSLPLHYTFLLGIAGIPQSAKSTCRNGTSDSRLTVVSKIAVVESVER